MKRYKVYWTEESIWEMPSIIEANDEDEAQDIAFAYNEGDENPVQGGSKVIEVFVEEVEE